MDGLVWVNKHQQTCAVASRVAASIPLQNGHFSGSMSNLGSVSPNEGLVELSFAFCFRTDSVSPLVDIALSSCPQVFDPPCQPCRLSSSSSSSSWKSRPSCNPSRLHPEIWSSTRPTQPILPFFPSTNHIHPSRPSRFFIHIHIIQQIHIQTVSLILSNYPVPSNR